MAKKSASFIDLHAEKVAIGVCALLMVGSVIFGLGGGRFSVNDRTVGELCVSAGDAADQTKQAVQNAKAEIKPPTLPSGAAKDPAAQLADWFGEKAKGLVKIADVQSKLPRTQAFLAPYQPIVAAGGSVKRQLAQIVAPDLPVVASGRSAFDFPAEKPELKGYDGSTQGSGKPVERNWVSIAAQVDLTKQDANFISESYPEGSYLEIVQVHLQRKDETDPRRGWEDIEAYLPFKPVNRPAGNQPDGGPSMEGFDIFRQVINAGANFIARPKLPSESALPPPLPYLDDPPRGGDAQDAGQAEQEATRRLRSWMELSKAAMSGKRRFKEPDLDAAYLLARAAAGVLGAKDKDSAAAKQLLSEVKAKLPRSRRADLQDQVRSPDRLMPIVAHDLDVQPGHTYVYRMRYEVYNVFAGNPGELANPDDARRLTVFSGWSPPSRPVEIISDTYFYLSKADRAKKEVTVTIFKVSRRDTKRQDYRVRVGEPIGRKERRGSKADYSTGVICVDIDFDRVVDGQKDVSMIYVDPSDGSLKERLLSRDKKDKVLQRLMESRTADRR